MLDRLTRYAQRLRGPAPADLAAGAPQIPGIRPGFTELPARPFAVAASAGGEHAFVSMPRAGARGLVALVRAHAELPAGAGGPGQAPPRPWRIAHVHWLADSMIPRGLAIDRSGRHLLIADSAGGLAIADTAALLAGAPDPIVATAPSPGAESMQLVLDRDERFAFLTDEDSATLTVFDLGGSLAAGIPEPRLLGQVRVPPRPVGVALTPDGEHLFVTSQRDGTQGVLSALRVADAVRDPTRARVISVAAGAGPVRVRVAPDGELVWVTARASNALLAFDRAGVLAGKDRAPRAVVEVGAAPVGLSLAAAGSRIVVANSNRYAKDSQQPQTLSVVDAGSAMRGDPAVIGTIPTGAFPREVVTLGDDRTVLVTNVFSQSLETVAVW